MRKVLKSLILALVVFANPFNAFADDPITITVIPSDIDPDNKPDKGQRIPPRPIVCTIDFDSNTIVSTSSLVNNADEYQISTEEGMCFYITESENEFVETLGTLHGTYIITFSGDDYALSGYFQN